ncbi:MAG: ABC transporter permease [Legionellaceae bacterium]|nr:ABC transporter permease [Legionellaceae bacterium]
MSSLAIEEIKAIKNYWLIWYTLGFQDIQLRYRRSALGPLWLTLSTAVMIYSMGFLYSHLFKLDLNKYFPYLTAGFICWNLILGLVKESSAAYTDSANYIRNQESFYSVFIMRIVFRNFMIFLHNILAFIPIAFIFKTGVGWHSLMIFPGLLMLWINGLLWGTVIGIVSTRYRDIEQIVGSLMQVIFFVTPVMWMPDLLPESVSWLFRWNPFAQFLALIRNPLMNQPVSMHAFLMVSLVTLVGLYLYMVNMNKYKYKIIFWL